MRINKTDILIILGFFILLLIVGIGSQAWLGEKSLMVIVITSSVFILLVIFEIYRRLVIEADRIKKRFSQRIEPLLSLFFTIRPHLPLPDSGNWAAPPDFLKKLTELVFRDKPEIIVEVGSGVSTVILSYCLKQIGNGKVISLEHDAKFAAISKKLISFHGLEDVATVVYAPLKVYEIKGKKWLWYDTSQLFLDKPIDLLVVDGPPNTVQKLARYPALPLLYDSFGDKVIIIGDDGNRKSEKEMVELWKEEFQELTYEFLKLENGAYLLSKGK